MDKHNIGDYVYHRLPQFVRDDYTIFASLMRDYYKWLSVDYDETKLLYSTLEDKMICSITELEANNQLKDLGVYDIFADLSIGRKRDLLLSINQLYATKGTSTFIEIAFIFLGIPVTVFNPRDRVLEASNTPYYTNLKAIELSPTEFDMFKNGFLSIQFVGDNELYPVMDVFKVTADRVRLTFQGEPDTNATHARLHYDDGVVTNIIALLNTRSLCELGYTVTSATSFHVGNDVVDEDGLVIGYISSISMSAISEISSTSQGTGYESGELVRSSDGKIIGAISHVGDNGELVSIRLFDNNHQYDHDISAIVHSTFGTGATLTVVWEGSIPGKPLTGHSPIDLNTFYTGAIYAISEPNGTVANNGIVLTLGTNTIITLPNSYGNKLINAPSSGNAFIHDSDKWQQFSRGVSIPAEFINTVPAPMIEHLAQVGVNVFVDAPDYESVYMSATINYNSYEVDDNALNLKDNLLMSAHSSFGHYNMNNADLIIPDRQMLTSVIDVSRIEFATEPNLMDFTELNSSIEYTRYLINSSINLITS